MKDKKTNQVAGNPDKTKTSDKSNMNAYSDLMKKALNTPKPTKEQVEQLKKKAK